MVVMEGGTVVMHLLIVSSLESTLSTTDFDQIFEGKFRLPVTKVYGGGQGPRIAAVGRPPWFLQTMLTLWWGVELLIPLLKHTK